MVLVEQDDPVTGAQRCRDVGVLLDEREGEGDLVRELDEPVARFPGGELGREVEQRDRGGEYRYELVDRAVGAAAAGRQVGDAREFVEHGPHVVGVDEVFGEGVRDVEHGGRHPVDAEVVVGEPLVAGPGDDAAGQLPGGRGAEHRAVGVAADEHRVVAVQARGEGVVGRDGRLRERVDDGHGMLGAGRQRRPAERRQPLADAVREFRGGLAGEGEAEHLVGGDVAVRDEPEHARRHRLGLARACPRNDECGPERRLNDRPLLGRRAVQPERVRDGVGADRRARRREGGSRFGCRHQRSPVTGGTRCRLCRRCPGGPKGSMTRAPVSRATAIAETTCPSRSRKAASASASSTGWLASR